MGCACAAQAQFEPVTLTSNSYNHDVIIEKTAAPPVVSVTSASMEQGIANTGFSWFERGYLPGWPQTGLPAAGSILISDQSPDYHYQMPANYQTNNAILIDSLSPSAVVHVNSPTNCAALSFLTSTASARNVIRYTVHYQDGSSETGTFTSPNWYNDGNPAWAASGTVNVTTFVHADITSYNPRLYSVDVALSDTVQAVTSLDLALASGIGHTAIFAVSAARVPGARFDPLGIAGYNQDLVVEAKAIKPGFLETNTTATMENGTGNSGFTWYEKGYNPRALETGLPAAGSLVTNQNDASHHFRMPSNYTGLNSVLFDSKGTNPVLVLTTPARYSTISFLTASSGGAVSNLCIVHHADGNSETNSFESPDWLLTTGAALTTHGRISVSTKMLIDQNGDGPSLFAVDVPVIDQNSPVTKIIISRQGKSTAGQAVIFALAAVTSTSGPPVRPALSITREENGNLTVRSTQSGRLESCSIFGTRPYWRDEGPILETLTLMRSPLEPVRFYRVIIP